MSTDHINLLSTDVNEMLNEDGRLPFKEKLIDFIEDMHGRKFLNKADISQEIRDMKVDVIVEKTDDYDIESYIPLLNVITGFRDRLTSILSRAHAEHLYIEKKHEALFNAWFARFSKLSSDKKREAEAEYVLDFLLNERLERENLFNYVKNSVANMNSKYEVVSRKISIVHEVHKAVGASYVDTQKMNVSKNKAKTKQTDIEGSGWDSI